MSFLSDLADAAERIADKALDFKIAEFQIARDAQAAPTTGTAAPVGSTIEQRPLSTALEKALPWIAAAGLAVVVFYVAKKG